MMHDAVVQTKSANPRFDDILTDIPLCYYAVE
jgi:hypothetical protein